MSFNPSLTYHKQGIGQEHVMFDPQKHIKSTLSNGQHKGSGFHLEMDSEILQEDKYK